MPKTPRHAFPVVLAVLVAALVALHPYLGSADLCGPGGCPHGVEAHASGPVDPSAAGRSAAALAMLPAALALFASRRPASDRRPEATYPCPEPPPPRLLPNR